jgi:branched-subunit amino acid transport protein
MLDLILCAGANMFHICLVKRFIDTLAGKSRLKKGQEFCAYGAFFLLTLGVYLAFHTVWVNILSNILGMMVLVGFCNKSIKENLFITGVIYLILAGCDIVAVLPFVDYVDGESFNQIYPVLELFPMFMCALIVEKIVGRRKNSDKVYNFPLIIVPACSILTLTLVIYSEKNQIVIVIVAVGLMVIDFSLLHLYNALCEAMAQRYENEMLRQQIDSYANQLDVILQSEERVRALRHDLKHHMAELQYLAEKNETTEMKDYINKMQSAIQNPDEFVSSGNFEMDSILNFMLQKAKEKGFIVNAKVQMPHSISHSFDINVILGNLLENAIEAGEQTAEKILNVQIRMKQGVLHIEVENSYLGPQALNTNNKCGRKNYLTTKSDKTKHGIGLGSVRRIVAENNGSIEVIPGEKFFKTKIILYTCC